MTLMPGVFFFATKPVPTRSESAISKPNLKAGPDSGRGHGGVGTDQIAVLHLLILAGSERRAASWVHPRHGLQPRASDQRGSRQVCLQEAGDVLQRGVALLEDCRECLEDVGDAGRHFQPHGYVGGRRACRQPHRIIEQDLEGPGLNEERR